MGSISAALVVCRIVEHRSIGSATCVRGKTGKMKRRISHLVATGAGTGGMPAAYIQCTEAIHGHA